MSFLGVIGGSGMNLEPQFDTLEAYEVSTIFGKPSAPIQKMSVSGLEFYFLARHGNPHRIAPHQVNYRANLQALCSREVEIVLAINAVGAISESLSPGQLIVPDQIIDYTWGREHTVDTGETASLMHIEFTEPFDEEVRHELIDIAQTLGIDIVNGSVIGVTQGPRLETAAEIRKLSLDGCNLVGMTSMPEAAIARELKLRYASICIVSNLAAGISEEKLSIDQIKNNVVARSRCIGYIIEKYVQRI